LWFEQPWVRVRDASKEAWPDTHSQGETEKELPFMGKDSPKPNTRPRRISAEEALYKLESIRQGAHLRLSWDVLQIFASERDVRGV
jgi:hypothetical protein